MKSFEGTFLNIPVQSIEVETDPQTMLNVASVFVNRQLYRGLMTYTSDMQLVNDLAESFEVKDEGKTYVFKLKELSFSDGSPIEAEDIEKTFSRMVKIDAAIAADLQSLIGFSAEDRANRVALGINALAKRVVEFRLHHADPFFIKNLAAVDCSILKLNSALELQNVTSGRFSLSPGNQELTLLPTSQLLALRFASPPHSCRLLLVETNERAARLAKEGLLDILETYEVSDEDSHVLKFLDWREEHTEVARTLFVSLNPRRLDLKERQLIFSSLLSQKGNGLPNSILPGFGLIPSALPGALEYDDIASLIGPLNPMSEERNPVRISFPEGAVFKEIALWIEKVLSKLKIKANLESFPWKDYFKRAASDDYDLFLRSKYLDYPDGMSLLTYFKSEEKINTFDAGDKAADLLIAQAQFESDDSKRTKLYKDIQYKLLSNFTLVPLSNATLSRYLVSPRVQSIKSHPIGRHSLHLHEVLVVGDVSCAT